MKRLLFSVGISDCDVEAIASTHGAGGQNRNRRHTAIRIRHRASGATSFSADERSQTQNKSVAFRRMAESPAFRAWLRTETAKRQGRPSVEEQVDAAMAPENLRVEVRGPEGTWVEQSLERHLMEGYGEGRPVGFTSKESV